MSDDAPRQQHPDHETSPEQVRTRQDLADALQVLHVRADRPSFRELEQRTSHGPVRLARTTISEMLSGKRLASKSVTLAFAEACGVTDPGPWQHAWERVAVAERRLSPDPPESQLSALREEIQQLNAQLTAEMTRRAKPTEADNHLYETLKSTVIELDTSGHYRTARDLQERIYSHTSRQLGAEHSDTLAARCSLALWIGEAGDPATARDQLTALVATHEQVFGPEDPRTLKTGHNLACWIGEAGDPATARKLLTDILSIRQRVLGPEHPDIRNTHRSLAWWIEGAADPCH